MRSGMGWTSSTRRGIRRSRWWSSWRESYRFGRFIIRPCVIQADFDRTKGSEQLISSDTHSGTANYKFTYSVELVPVCKDDLVCLPRAQAKAWGNIS